MRWTTRWSREKCVASEWNLAKSASLMEKPYGRYAWSFIATSPCAFNAVWTRREDLFRVGSNTRQEWISESRLQKGRGLSLKIASRGRRTRLRRGGDYYFPIHGKDVDDSALSLATRKISRNARDSLLSIVYQFRESSDRKFRSTSLVSWRIIEEAL